MENHSWEKILLKFCYFNKIKTYGYIHATMPFWHLNYYQPDNLNLKNRNLPNKILTISKLNLRLLKNQKINKEKLILVEALRYNWLNTFKKKKFLNNNSKKILVFGDYEKKINEQLFKLLINFLQKNRDFLIYFKPHPGDITQYYIKNKKIKITYNLSKQSVFRFYIFSNSTSASAEYTHLTDNIAIFRSQLSVNLSPFKDLNYNNKIFFSNDTELFNIINLKKKNKFKNFFYINNNLTNWKKIIHEEKF